MLKEIVTNIKNKIQEKRQKIKLEYRRKYFEIKGAVIKFYEDKATTDDTIELPAFMRADEILKEVIKTPADIDFYYKKLVKYKAVA